MNSNNSEENKAILKQVAIGGVSGLMTSYVSMKVGKVAAIAVGGGLLLLEIANYNGYINVNWSRLSNDVDKVKSRIQEEAKGKKEEWTDKLEKKTTDIVKKQRRWFNNVIGDGNEKNIVKDVSLYATSFVVGFGVGVLTAK